MTLQFAIIEYESYAQSSVSLVDQNFLSLGKGGEDGLGKLFWNSSFSFLAYLPSVYTNLYSKAI